jgi:hypothetical protein
VGSVNKGPRLLDWTVLLLVMDADPWLCVADGLFGQCRSSKQDQVQYQVSVPVLKRMQEVLKQLMMHGTT